MQSVEFEEEASTTRISNTMATQNHKKSLTRFLIKKNIVSNEKSANVLLFIIAIVSLIVSLFIVVTIVKQNTNQKDTIEKYQNTKQVSVASKDNKNKVLYEKAE